MQRRKFVKSAAIVALGVTGASLGFSSIKRWYEGNEGGLKTNGIAQVSDKLDADFKQLVSWMQTNGWADHLHDTLGINLTLTGKDLVAELIKELDKDKLAALRLDAKAGYDDFAGERLVQPGFPAYSLLFHTIASPRVRSEIVKDYPTLQQIDVLENYIYALCDWGQLKSIYGIKSNEELVFAVFAYEYRPAFKTPHHAYADMVYSRTGIGRIGDEPMNYDKVNRCHTNRPADAALVKHIAVVPARYGLYLARKVPNTSISLIKEDLHKGEDSKDDRHDDSKTFLQPIRKVFNDDILVGNATLQYSELHKSEKLHKLSHTKGIVMKDKNLMPQIRLSDKLVEQDAAVRNVGSSFMVISQHADMIRPSRENGHILFFEVPVASKEGFDNRYFTALCTQGVEDVELLEGNDTLRRVYNEYLTPRNQPLFVNITNEVKDDTTYAVIAKTPNNKFEDKVQKGRYYAPLFEDSICDGKVEVNTHSLKLDKLAGIGADCLPAFSIVTAPDFFPQVDPMDLESDDIAPGPSKESNFYEGGVASLATARIKPNPKIIDTKTEKTSDTYLAVLSSQVKENTGVAPQMLPIYKNPASERGYEISGFLPDVASSVFAPGWDVTYCSLDDIHDIYIGTEGLGSPFIEDMKFCSALNGMWPATSPDAARTYQGSNEANFRNPTAVPLLDAEIGICATGPAGKGHECYGWDGEQGPYIEKIGKQWKINFIDIGRADAVSNALTGMIDMSKLRVLKSAELIDRMDCLKTCIRELPQKNFNPEEYKRKIPGYTYLWLVSAEKVNWGKDDAAALGIPASLVGNDKSWITDKANAKVSGAGYLYVFANSAPDDNDEKEWTSDLKRRRLDCKQLYVCQVTNDTASHNKIAWTEIKDGKTDWQVK